MSKLRFDGRVAIITGAGRGLGRAYAELLAERGARVVVNDLGGSSEGEGASTDPAQEVVDAIAAAGGEAVADVNDVSSVDGAQAIVDAALERFGRLDIVVNNAGIMRWAGLPDVDLENLERHLAVHLRGSFNVTRAAWPRLLEQEYGRVVFATSTGIFGHELALSYSTAKGAIIGLARSAAVGGEPHGIKVNMIAPIAQTRLAGSQPLGHSDESVAYRVPAAAAPLVGLLAHESCPVNGEIYTAGAGRFARLFIASTEGYVRPDSGVATIEEVAENWDAINDEDGYYVPPNLLSWSAEYQKHIA